ncbi:MAG: DsbA family protein [Pyrinomonadaceae bacterium]
MKKSLPVVIIIVVLLVAVGGGVWLMQPASNTTGNQPPPQTAARPNASRSDANDAPPAHVRGQQNAPVVFEEFADFQCPTCANMHSVVKQLVEKYPTQVGVGFRHFPLREMHKHAAEAARAAEAAALQGKFWEMHDLLYDKQKEWEAPDDARPLFTQYAQTLGLNMQKFNEDIDSSIVAMRIVADERRGAALGVHATPTFYINGRELTFDESNTLDKLSAAVDQELARKK